MKKTKLLSALFIIVTLACIGYGIVIVMDSLSYQNGIFSNDGYAVVLNSKTNKTKTLPFESGTEYNYKKYNDEVSFTSDGESVSVDDTTVIHYLDNSLLVLKNVVGIDLEKVDNNVIFYYNIFKNTQVNYSDNYYSISSTNNGEINFQKLLLRISDSKFLLVGDNIRAVLSNDEIVGFDNYVYFEYTDGSIVKIYDGDKCYQTIIDDSNILIDNITINLKDKTISKDGTKYITLSNLVIDMDSNIDVLVAEETTGESVDIAQPNIDTNITVPDSDDSSVVVDDNTRIEDSSDEVNVPVYTIADLKITSLRIDATIEINDDDSLLSGPTKISIVENATAKTVYETVTEFGDLRGYISYPNLKPDTEYTLYATASYTVDDITYDKIFISKIFRTEALGVGFKKSYATENTITIDVSKEDYSKVSSVTIGIFDTDGNTIDYSLVDISNENKIEVTFDGLDSNTTYLIMMYDILSDGVIIDDGLTLKENIMTLKSAPSVGGVEYTIDKREATFILNASDVEDNDYGIVEYRYEVYDARLGLESTPVVTISKEKLASVSVNVDDIKVYRGVAYTYRLVVEFYDNEKTVEYSYELGSTMQLDGVSFPTVRWSETYVTWEQINGSIIIDDPSGTIVGDSYKIVYKNSADVYTTMSLTGDTTTNAIPIAVNYLRANETYTFDVYAKINLQDGNPTIDEAYIGSVKVNTKSPNSLSANFQSTSSLLDPFSIVFSLSSSSNDASLEASTLSTMTFTLYQGSTTDGMVEVYRKSTDTNADEYTSSLKQLFYDNSTVIDADFFNSDSSIFKQKVYTLVIDKAYDYTGYNEIPIENNVFQFKISNYIPNLPDESESIFEIHAISNKLASDFGLDIDSSLNADTKVGYSVNIDFDNSSKMGKYVVYHVWRYNQETDQYDKIESLDRKVEYASDGTLENTIFEVGSGTKEDVVDSDMMRRGNKYYFTVDIYLDVDGDGVAETVYPTLLDSNVTLKSGSVAPSKQSSIISLYPSSSTANTFAWNYKLTDIDNSLASNQLYAFMNADDQPVSYADIAIGSDNYKTVNFMNLTADNILTIKKYERLMKKNDANYVGVTSQYFYGYRDTLDLSYSITSDVNKFIITFDDYLNKADEISSIAKLDINIIPVDESIQSKTISNVTIDGYSITLDYTDIAEYINTDITIELIAYFDTNKIGFDLDSEYIVIQNGSYSVPGNYYRIRNDNLVQSTNIYGSLLSYNFDLSNKLLTVNKLSGGKYNFDIDIDNTGVLYQNNNILLKEIKSEKLKSSSDTVRFDTIIPSVSLLANNKVNITSLLTGAYVNAKISDVSSNIQDDQIYLEIYEVNDSGNEYTYVETVSKNVSDFANPIELTNLKLRTNYFLKLYAYVYNQSTASYEKMYLYDVDQKAVGCSYNFHTLSDVGISNVSGYLYANSYTDKNLVVSYNMENTIGIDYIKYTLYHKTDSGYELVNVNIDDSTIFLTDMSVSISASPNTSANISYGETYLIRMDVYSSYENDGESEEMLIMTYDNEFTVQDYEQPFIGISSGKTEDSVYFRVSVIDSSYLIPGGVYKVTLTDSNGNIIYEKSGLSIEEYNRKFEFDRDEYNLVDGESYTFKVTINADYSNDTTDFETINSSRTIKFGTDIYLGTIALSYNGTNSINMIFSNSYQLSEIDKISYTITNDVTGFVLNATKAFNVRFDSATNAYYYTIDIDDENFDPKLLYTITVNFYVGNELVENVELGYCSSC